MYSVDQWYFAHLDHTGRRTDAEHRPELYYGAYEYGATKQYCKVIYLCLFHFLFFCLFHRIEH